MVVLRKKISPTSGMVIDLITTVLRGCRGSFPLCRLFAQRTGRPCIHCWIRA